MSKVPRDASSIELTKVAEALDADRDQRAPNDDSADGRRERTVSPSVTGNRFSTPDVIFFFVTVSQMLLHGFVKAIANM
jgi:hypothetical protein